MQQYTLEADTLVKDYRYLADLLKNNPLITVILVLNGLYAFLERAVKLAGRAREISYLGLKRVGSRYHLARIKREMGKTGNLIKHANEASMNPSLYLLRQLRAAIFMVLGLLSSVYASLQVGASAFTAYMSRESAHSSSILVPAILSLMNFGLSGYWLVRILSTFARAEAALTGSESVKYACGKRLIAVLAKANINKDDSVAIDILQWLDRL